MQTGNNSKTDYSESLSEEHDPYTPYNDNTEGSISGGYDERFYNEHYTNLGKYDIYFDRDEDDINNCCSDSDSDISPDKYDNDQTANQLQKEQFARRQFKMMRRKHSNSKYGCSLCKQRKIKCDEDIPMCSYCKKKGNQCSFLTMTPFQIHQILHRHKSHKKHKRSSTSQNIPTPMNDSSNTDFPKPSVTHNQYIPYGDMAGYEYTYNPKSDLNINNTLTNKDNISHGVSDMERSMLPPSFIGRYTPNSGHHDTNQSCITSGKIYNYINTTLNYSNQFPINPSIVKDVNAIPLSSCTRKSDKTFIIDNSVVVSYFQDYCRDLSVADQLIYQRNFELLSELLLGKRVDAMIIVQFTQNLCLSQVYETLLRKSMLLLAMDHYKNVLLKQDILKTVTYMVKLSISCKCENESVKYIDEISQLIKYNFIPYFNNFTSTQVDMLTGCFFVLNKCLKLHFKNGLKYEIGHDEANQAVKLVGIFSTGLYSIVMERSREHLQNRVLMSYTSILSAHLFTHFKRFFIKNYHVNIFDEIKNAVDKLSNRYINDVNYENLKLFCDKHTKLLGENINKESLQGFNNGCLLRIVNSFISIIPFDSWNFNPIYLDKFRNKELDIIINLFYYTIGHTLNAIFPGTGSLAISSYAGLGSYLVELDDTKNIMKFFKLIKSKELQLTAVFLIRMASFFKNQRSYYNNFLIDFPMDELLDENNDESINDKYLKLKKIKESGVMYEDHVKTFVLSKGQFIRQWNYPSTVLLKPRGRIKVSNNKIMNHYGGCLDDLVLDFIQNDNGFLSPDYAAFGDVAKENTVASQAPLIDGNQMKVLWKLSTYIRMNNL